MKLKQHCHNYTLQCFGRYLAMNNRRKPRYIERSRLYEYLSMLTAAQFKIFYTAFVHYWGSQKGFISNQNFFNLWCELNQLCYELDESFPDQFDDYEEMKIYCHFHPYYFIDRLPLDLVAGLFADHVDNHFEILTTFVKTLIEADMYAAYTYMNEALGLTESVDELVSQTQTHIEFFKYK